MIAKERKQKKKEQRKDIQSLLQKATSLTFELQEVLAELEKVSPEMRTVCEGDIVAKILETPLDGNNEEILDGTDDEKTKDKGSRKDIKPLVKDLPLLGSPAAENEDEDDIAKILERQKNLRSEMKRALEAQAALAAAVPEKRGRKPKEAPAVKKDAKRRKPEKEEKEDKDAASDDEFSMEEAQTRSDQAMKEERAKEDDEEEDPSKGGGTSCKKKRRGGGVEAKSKAAARAEVEVEDPKTKEEAPKTREPKKPKDWTILCVSALFCACWYISHVQYQCYLYDLCSL